jgi:hypothetical protein
MDRNCRFMGFSNAAVLARARGIGKTIAAPGLLAQRCGMVLRTAALEDITIEDADSFRHVGLVRALERRLRRDGATFAVPDADSAYSSDDTMLLNHAFWQPRGTLEVLPAPSLFADQLVHAGWHHVAGCALGDHAASSDGLLLAEAVASAFDIYLVGRLLGHAPDSSFLATQVPRMQEAAETAGASALDFERVLEQASREPERSFELLRQLLFDVATDLVACEDTHAAAAVLDRATERELWMLLHHYEVTTWVLYARAYATSRAPDSEVRRVDGALRAAPDALAWLEREWLGEPT